MLNGGRADYKKMVLALGEGWWAGVGGGGGAGQGGLQCETSAVLGPEPCCAEGTRWVLTVDGRRVL